MGEGIVRLQLHPKNKNSSLIEFNILLLQSKNSFDCVQLYCIVLANLVSKKRAHCPVAKVVIESLNVTVV